MISVLRQLVGLVLISTLLGLGIWWAQGAKLTLYQCPETLLANEVCVSEWKDSEGVLWVDARSRIDFEQATAPGAVLISDHFEEDPDQQIAEHAEKILTAQKVIVFCRSQACESSKVIAKLIKDSGLNPEVVTLHGGEVALKSAGILLPSE